MPRFRSQMRLRPIQRIKHVVDLEGNVDDTPVVSLDVVLATDTPTLAQTAQVITGSTVHGIYIKIEATHTSGTGRPNFYFIVFKNPGGNLPALGFVPNAIGANDNKRFVFHQEMVMLSGDASNGLPRVVFNGVVKIPKGFSRMGPNDKISINLVTGNAGVAADWCMQVHYKEFR